MNRIKFISLTSLCAWALLVSCGCGKAAQRTDPSAEPSLEPSEDPSPEPSEEPSAEPVFTRYQRDQILRYIDLLCESLTGTDTRTYNTKRLAKNLAKRLRAKESVSADELRNIGIKL